MAISSETNTLLWEKMLDADMRSRYYLRLAAILSRLELSLSILTAVLSSGAFLSLALEVPWTHAAQWCALAAVITSTWLVFSKHGKRAELAAARAHEWMAIQSELERLWSRRGATQDSEVHKILAREDKQILAGAGSIIRELPLNDRLSKRAQREVLVARGLAHG
jgi:hypothetical protein